MPQTAPLTSHTTSAWSADGFVEVQVRAGRVQQVYVDPHWRSTQLEQVVERSIAEATNIALNQQTQQVYEALYRAAPSGDLARNLTRAAADVEYGAGRGAELPGALRELGTVLQGLEDADFMPEQLEPPAPPVLVDVLDDDTDNQVHVAAGQVAHLGLDVNWSRETDEEQFLGRVTELINAGLEKGRDAQLEQLLASPSGHAGLASALWEANSYVVSAHLMDLDKMGGQTR